MSTLISADNLGRDNVTQGEFKGYIEEFRQYIEDGLGTDSDTILSNMVFDNTISGFNSTDPKSAFDEISTFRKQVTINFTTDTDLTLTNTQNQYGRLILTDTGVILTTSKNVIVDNKARRFLVQNNTLQSLTIKTLSGTGVEILPTEFKDLYCDGTNVLNITSQSSLEIATAEEIRNGTDNSKVVSPLGYTQTTFGWGQTRTNETLNRSSGVAYPNNTGKPILIEIVFANLSSTANVEIRKGTDLVATINPGAGPAKIPYTTVLNNLDTITVTLISSATIESWYETK